MAHAMAHVMAHVMVASAFRRKNRLPSVFICAAITACALAGAQAQQPRRAADGVYSAAQAMRGEELVDARCAMCHGAALAGDAAPPLAGPAFLNVWSAQPLADLFDKIHNTMPTDAPGTLTRPQVADVVSYILQVNKFPAGRAELDPGEASLKQISIGLATAAPPARAAAPAGAATQSFPAVGNVNQVMRGILFPSSNVLFDVQLTDPGARKAGAKTETAAATARYGDVYDGWSVVDAAAISIAEAGPLLMIPGRRCENGKTAPTDRADWQAFVGGLVDAGRASYRASQRRNQEAVSDATNQISDACANCHKVYRDRPTAAERCTPLQ
jgi:mono/diheme cytochrome c family protein